jgi:hypothetical protein
MCECLCRCVCVGQLPFEDGSASEGREALKPHVHVGAADEVGCGEGAFGRAAPASLLPPRQLLP